MEKFILEGCVDSVESAIAAEKGGANRLELCANLTIGGTTVRPSVFAQVRENVRIPIRVLIRPRFGDFLYNDYEIREMEQDIITLRSLGADGIVIGMLKKNGELDIEGMKRLIAAGDGCPVTLHRAFDVCVDPYKAMEQAIDLGIHTILTSGQQDHCLLGKALLADLAVKAEDRIEIMCGSGVNAAVIEEMCSDTIIKAYHMSGKMTVPSGMEYRKEGVNMGLKGISEFEKYVSNEAEFAKACAVLTAK